MSDMFTNVRGGIDKMIATVAREVGMRRSVYARRVAAGKMSETTAERQIEEMADVLAYLQSRRNQE